MKYGRLEIISRYSAGTHSFAICQCDCGSPQRAYRLDKLRSGWTQSCGCFHKERVTKHGAWNNPLFNVWAAMMRRCYNPHDKRFQDYGKRGISVCKRWHEVNAFIEDMKDRYQKGLQIDRKDNNGSYNPENCKWSTLKEQGRNKRNNVLLTHNRKTHCLSEWAEITGIKYGTLWDRVKIQCLTPNKALTK